MKKLLMRIFIVIAALVGAGLVILYFSLDSVVKKGVEEVGPIVVKVPVTLGAAHVSPLSGGGRLTKLFVGNPEGYTSPSAIEVADVKLGVAPGSVFSQTIVINEINLQGAEITLEGTLTKNNLMTILDNVKGANAPPKGAPAPSESKTSKKFIVKDLVIADAKVHLDLNLPGIGVQKMTVPVPAVHLQNIGTAEGGVSAEELVQDVMKPLLENVLKAATDALGNAAGQLKNIGTEGAKGAGKVLKGIGNLFK